MRYFLDTEFYEDGKTIDLISIALVAEDGREFYACNQDAQLHRVSPWVRSNVLPKLPPYGNEAWMPHQKIGSSLLNFVRHVRASDTSLEVWAYYADYDWVVLCQLFGTMMDLPSTFPKFCRDLKQLSCDLGSPEHPVQLAGNHSALADARWNKELYDFLMSKR